MSTKSKSQRCHACPEAPFEMCSVRIGDGLFGLPISHILEIVGSALQPAPLAPGFVGGLIHYRGDVQTTISLRQNALPVPRDPAKPANRRSQADCAGRIPFPGVSRATTGPITLDNRPFRRYLPLQATMPGWDLLTFGASRLAPLGLNHGGR